MIFNKNNHGNEEIKAILGFVNKAITFNDLVTLIDLATEDLKEDLIGAEIYKVAEDHYHSANYEDSGSGSGSTGSGSGGRSNSDLDNLVHAIQKPIAFLAYRNFANSGDLLHTNRGRQVSVDEHTGRPFAWQIERDDKNLLNIGYKLQDFLLKYLEDNISIYPEFRNSDSYTEAKSLFINTTKDFDSIFPIDKSRRLFWVLRKFIREIEEKTFKPVLADQYDTLKAAILANNPTADQLTLLGYIKTPLALLTMGTAITRLSVNVLPEGIYQSYQDSATTTTPKNAAATDVRREVSNLILRDAQSEMNRLLEYLAKKSGGTTYDPQTIVDHNDEANKYFRV